MRATADVYEYSLGSFVNYCCDRRQKQTPKRRFYCQPRLHVRAERNLASTMSVIIGTVNRHCSHVEHRNGTATMAIRSRTLKDRASIVACPFSFLSVCYFARSATSACKWFWHARYELLWEATYRCVIEWYSALGDGNIHRPCVCVSVRNSLNDHSFSFYEM